MSNKPKSKMPEKPVKKDEAETPRKNIRTDY